MRLNLYVDYEYETRETETTPKYDYTDELGRYIDV